MDSGRNNRNPDNFPESIGKYIGGLIVIGVGITALIFLWGTPFNEFGSPPIFFRIFISFIALNFILVGGRTFLSRIFGGKIFGNRFPATPKNSEEEEGASDLKPNHSETSLNYTCPQCSAPLSNGVEVSPHGDVRCSFCNSWYNIHGK
jgi:hypothetical protein